MRYIQSKTIAERVKINDAEYNKTIKKSIYDRVMRISSNAIIEHENYKKEQKIVYRWEK